MMLKNYVRFQNWVRRHEGQALSEYGMIIAIVLVAAIGGLIAFRDEIKQVLSDVTAALKNNH
ncbi:MAG TPA: Flp family type IVb pilin [Symbiobacteriaceae bacterium]